MYSIHQMLYPVQVLEGIKRTLSPSLEGDAKTYATKVTTKVNDYFIANKDGENVRCKKNKDIPFTFWAFKGEKGLVLCLIPNTKDVNSWRGSYKKVKEAFYLYIDQNSPHNSSIPPQEIVCSRIPDEHAETVLKGIKIQTCLFNKHKTKELFADPPFAKFFYISKKGEKKHEFFTRKYPKTLKAIHRPFSFSQMIEAIDSVKSIANAVSILQKETPLISHSDIKRNNCFSLIDGKAVLADFDLAQVYNENSPLFAHKLGHFYHLPFLYMRYRDFPQTDLYSLAILTAETLLYNIRHFIKIALLEEGPVENFLKDKSLGLFCFQNRKALFSADTQRSIEAFFLQRKFCDELVAQDLLMLAKQELQDPQEISLCNDLAYELILFSPVFDLLKSTLLEDEKSKKNIPPGMSKALFKNYRFPSAETIIAELDNLKNKMIHIDGPMIEKTLTFSSPPSASMDGQILHAPQISELVKKILGEDHLDFATIVNHLVENSNAYLTNVSQEDFYIRFHKGKPWGAGHILPFSGMICRNEKEITIYLIPSSNSTKNFEDAHYKIKEIFSSTISRRDSKEDASSVQRALMSRYKISSQNYDIFYLQEAKGLIKSKELKARLACLPSHFHYYVKNSLTKMEFYDKTHEFIGNHFDMPSLTKLNICLELVKTLQMFSREGLVHSHIRPQTLLINISQDPIRVQVSDCAFITLPNFFNLTADYKYWNFIGNQGCHSLETDLHALIEIMKDYFIKNFDDKKTTEDNIKKHLNEFVQNSPSHLQESVHRIFQECNGYGTLFSQKLLELSPDFLKEYAYESLVVDKILSLLNQTAQANATTKTRYRQHSPLFPKQESCKRSLINAGFPSLIEIENILERSKESILELEASTTSKMI